MPDKDINIHVRGKGTRQTKREMDEVARSARGVGKKAKEGQQQAEASFGKTDQKLSGMARTLTKLKGLVMGFFGAAAVIRAVTSAIRAQTQALEEHAEIALRQQEKLLRLQHLGGLFKERPDLREEVSSLAEYGVRPFEEVADAWYNLRSKGAGLSKEQKSSIMKEALELGRMDPGLPLDTLIDMFSLYAKKTSQQDANRIQNVLLQTITEAGGSGAEVARYMPEFLPIGMAGGLTGAQAAGLWAYATTQAASVSVATTGLRRTFAGLQGRGTPESKKLLKQFGITPGMNFFEQIGILSGQFKAGNFSLAQAQLLAGEEGAAILLSLLQDPQAMMQTVGKVMGVDTGDIDIARGQIEQLLGQDEMAFIEEDTRRLKIEIENMKARDINATRLKRENLLIEYGLRKEGTPEYFIRAAIKSREIGAGVGLVKGAPLGAEGEGAAPVIINNDYSNNTYQLPAVGELETQRFTQD